VTSHLPCFLHLCFFKKKKRKEEKGKKRGGEGEKDALKPFPWNGRDFLLPFLPLTRFKKKKGRGEREEGGRGGPDSACGTLDSFGVEAELDFAVAIGKRKKGGKKGKKRTGEGTKFLRRQILDCVSTPS